MTSKPLADTLKSFPPLPPFDRGHVTEWLRMIAFIAWCREVPNRQWADIALYFVPNDTPGKGILSLTPTPMMDWEAFEPWARRTFATSDSSAGKAALLTANTVGVVMAPWAVLPQIPRIALQAATSARTALVSGSFPSPPNFGRITDAVRSVQQIVDDVQVDQEAMILKTSSGVYLLLGPVSMTDCLSAANFRADGFKVIGNLDPSPTLVEEICSQKRYLAFVIEDSSKVSSKL
ncbi:hypothetical protein EV421DRAFT_1802342 [Armillaria borealis]|uniref:Uncharacterized protein n=1 Tax=Armillaria borealis TaxID=47425 RepID=A0AA39JLW4_9AGAR|nr:hypothetical protein EV421DRAFT_1802342 [Armillaria borealis]